MRRLLVVVMLLALAGSAMAVSPSNRPEAKPDGVIYEGGGRVGGDNVGVATVIGSLPYYDSGNTCGFINDYDEICPYSGSTSPDVVYVYTPGAAEAITVNLCDSAYDTKVYIYDNAVGNLIACNDDAGCGYSGWQSLVENVALAAGHNYYIVVDGYGGACGDYVMTIDAYAPCVVDCPAGALIEGEPPCVDNYFDMYNGGCNSTGWTAVEATVDGCADVCGKSCTYVYQGLSYRDTDWYEMTALGGNATVTCTAEFPLQLILFYQVLNCNSYQYLYTTAGVCQPATLSQSYAAGTVFWVWVGASVFSGIPESDYHYEICGIEGGIIPVETKSWGQIKNDYK